MASYIDRGTGQPGFSREVTHRQRERLAAIGQYLYDYVLAPVKHSGDTMPLEPWETVTEIERLLDVADQQLARIDRSCVGGERVLVEQVNDSAARRG